jgi:hypothetical protein
VSVVSAPMPVHDPIAELRNPNVPEGKKDPRENQCTDVWRKWLQSIVGEVQDSSRVTNSLVIENQTASIVSGLLSVVINSGLYRASVYSRVTIPASVSSSLGVVIRWSDSGVACSYAPSAVTGNATNTVLQYTWVGPVDASTQITYDVNYASAGTEAMQYTLRLVLEKVKG